MIFNIKSIEKNTDIVCIYSQRPALSECLLISKVINRQAKLKNRHIVIKFNRNTILNNFFTEMLISAKRICDKNGSSISLCAMNPDILCIFYLLKLDSFFEFYENEHDAFLRSNRLIKRRLKAV